MKKIPTLFVREFSGHKIVGIRDEITPDCEEAFLHGTATVKIDGACCAFMYGRFYKRYDAKKGKTPPEGAIPCCDPDPITGHHPHWVEIDRNNPSDKWFCQAYDYTVKSTGLLPLLEGTYEAVGPHFNGNPHHLERDLLVLHGVEELDIVRDFDHVKSYLSEHMIEGIVFWLNNEPVCKIKRSDFGFKWPG